MTVLSNYRTALASTARVWRIVLLLWVIDLGFAALLVTPLAAALFKMTSHSTGAQRLTGFFNSALLVDLFFGVSHDAGLAAGATLAATLLVAALVHTVTVGGVLGRIDASARGGDGFSAIAGFMADSGRYAWRSIRLTVLGIPLTLAVFIILQLVSTGIHAYARGQLYRSPVAWLELVRLCLALVLFVSARAMVDGARAAMFVEEGRSMWRALLEGIRLVARRPGPALGSYALAGATLTGAAAVVFFLRIELPEAGWAGVVFAFVVGQIAVMLRLAATVSTSAAALHAWQGRHETP
jgi:hypothetical protein